MPTHRQGNMNPGPMVPTPKTSELATPKKPGRTRKKQAARPNTKLPKVTTEPTVELDIEDPPNVFMTAHGHLGADIIHHPGPSGETPIYDQTAKALGWDPRVDATPLWEQKLAKKKTTKKTESS